MAKKKNKHYNLCKDCLLRDYCEFKDKDNPKVKVVGLFGVEGIELECPEDLGGYPELAGVPPAEKKKRKKQEIEAEKNRIKNLKMTDNEEAAYVPNRLKNKKEISKDEKDS